MLAEKKQQSARSINVDEQLRARENNRPKFSRIIFYNSGYGVSLGPWKALKLI